VRASSANVENIGQAMFRRTRRGTGQRPITELIAARAPAPTVERVAVSASPAKFIGPGQFFDIALDGRRTGVVEVTSVASSSRRQTNPPHSAPGASCAPPQAPWPPSMSGRSPRPRYLEALIQLLVITAAPKLERPLETLPELRALMSTEAAPASVYSNKKSFLGAPYGEYQAHRARVREDTRHHEIFARWSA